MTHQPINEEQLLAFIEGELTDDEAGHLRRSIEQSDPALVRRLDAMAGDRAALRELPAVDPPVDFLAEIEPMIARPMLMDSPAAQPGAVRRAHHRRQRRMQFLQAAAAAAIVIGLSIGVLFTIDALGVFHNTSTSTVATRDQANASGSAVAADNADADDNALDAAIPAEGELHHKLPSPTAVAGPMRRRAATGASTPTPTPERAAPLLVHADFALVLAADDWHAAETSLIAALDVRSDARSSQTALVRNLTVDELRRIEQRWMARRAAAGNPVRQPMSADVDGGDAHAPGSTGDRLGVPRSLLNENAEELVRAGLVAGNRELMPQYSRQIELSRSGAAYTIAVPLIELQPLLERLSAADIASAALRAFDVQSLNSGNEAPALDDAGWPNQLRRIRASIAELERDNPDAVLLLPVVVEAE